MNHTDADINIVILSKDPENTALLTRALNDSDLHIKSIKKIAGIDALQKIPRRNRPDVIFMDTGKEHDTETFAALKEGFRSIPVIIITEKKNEKFAYALMEQGATDFFKKAKQYDPLVLEKSVRFSIKNKLTAESLRLSNERYELVSKATNDMAWDWDLLNNRVFRSVEGWENIFGKSSNDESEHADSWWDRVHPDDKKKSNAVLGKVLKDPGSDYFELECRVLRYDRSYATVIDRGYAVRNQQGDVVRLVGATQDITDKKAAEEKLAAERRIMQNEITNAVITAQEQEREELGKELHDNINQILATTKLYIEYALSDEKLRNGLLKTAKGLIESAVSEIRALSRRLRPASLGEVGLFLAVHELAESLRPVNKFKIITKWNNEDEAGLPESLKLTIFRIVQEQLTNISRHAHATQVRISFRRTAKTFSLVINDNGKGFDLNKKINGVGLKNILSRAELNNGRSDIVTSKGKGCRLSVVFKLQE